MIYFNNRNCSSGLTRRLIRRLISATAIYGRWNSYIMLKKVGDTQHFPREILQHSKQLPRPPAHLYKWIQTGMKVGCAKASPK